MTISGTDFVGVAEAFGASGGVGGRRVFHANHDLQPFWERRCREYAANSLRPVCRYQPGLGKLSGVLDLRLVTNDAAGLLRISPAGGNGGHERAEKWPESERNAAALAPVSPGFPARRVYAVWSRPH